MIEISRLDLALLLWAMFALIGWVLAFLLVELYGACEWYVKLTAAILLWVWTDRELQGEMDELFAWCWEAGIRGEPFLDTDPAAPAEEPNRRHAGDTLETA